MTQEDKQLLLKDLSTRVPYHVRCKIWLKDGTTEEGLLDLEHNYGNVLQDAFYYNKIKVIKPFLFPLSSMTEEQKEESPLEPSLLDAFINGRIYLFEDEELTVGEIIEMIDWCNKNHFDYRGLIEKGLAIDATNLKIY
mgnify:CR=1 FL=1